MKLTYELKNIKNSNHPDFIEAIKLYLDNTRPDLRTDSKEIAHWLDVCNKRFPDPFYILGFYLNGRLIGFSELAYFVLERFVIIDYIVIEKAFRERGAFHVFLGEILQFIRRQHPEFHYIVGEVGCHSGNALSNRDKALIRTLKTVEFGVVKSDYSTPRMTDFESSMKAILMLYSPNAEREIRRDEFLQIVKAIYYKYYLRWINEFESEDYKIKYGREVSELISKLENKLKNKNVIEVNGFYGFETDSNSEDILQRGRKIKLLSTGIVFLISLIFVGGAFWASKVYLGMSSNTVKSVFYISFIMLVVFLIIIENKSNVFTKLIEKLINKIA